MAQGTVRWFSEDQGYGFRTMPRSLTSSRRPPGYSVLLPETKIGSTALPIQATGQVCSRRRPLLRPAVLVSFLLSRVAPTPGLP